MPIYEYRCEGCGRKVSVLVRRMGEEAAQCPRCGSPRLVRLYSRFAFARSEEDRLERLADEVETTGIDENDPKSVARWMRRMGEELGEDGEEFEEALEEIERGGLSDDEAGEDAGEAGAES
ncbi:MAG: FmdB family zinc ribbon protein [Bryobacteraceae bacterium]